MIAFIASIVAAVLVRLFFLLPLCQMFLGMFPCFFLPDLESDCCARLFVICAVVQARLHSHGAVCSVQCAVCSVQCAQCTVHSAQCTVRMVHSAV